VGITKALRDEAIKKKISVRPCNVIYKLIDDIKKEINKKLPMVDAEEILGIRNVHELSRLDYLINHHFNYY
jgi:translation initiation factor IF-2